MREERMRVLALVEEGKITVEDATKLLEALSMSVSPTEEYAQDSREFERKVNAFAKNAEAFARECGCKMEGAFREVEPKLRKASKVVLTKTASVIDELAKALNENLQNMEKQDCCCNDNCCCDDDCCDDTAEDCGCGCGCDDAPREN